MRNTLFYIILLANLAVSAQNRIVLDSLDRLYQNASHDTSRINHLIQLSSEYEKSDYSAALGYAQEAVELAKKERNNSFLAKTSKALAHVYFMMGNYKNASRLYFDALKFYESQDDTVGMITININLGAIHDRLTEFDKALQYYLKSQDLLNVVAIPEPSKTRYLVPLYNNIANIYQTKSEFQSARQYYEKTLSLARDTDNKPLQGIALNNLGKLYMNDLDDPEKAINYLREGLEVRTAIGDKASMAMSYVQLSDYYHKRANLDSARYCANQAIRLGQEIGSLEMQKAGYQCLSNAEEYAGNFEAALQAHRIFKLMNDSIQNQLAGSEITKLQLQYDFDKAEQERVQERARLRTKYTIAIIALGSGLLIAILIAILIRSRAKQVELKRKNLAQDIEIKNKELTTNVMYLIRKNELINDVAERLLNLKSRSLPENQRIIHDIIMDLQREADSDTWKEFELRFNQVHTDFYDKLRDLYPGLSPTEEKLCAFLRLNMSSKEIAAISKQSVKSVEVARARLRKKLNLTNTNSNLVTHLASL